MMDNKEKSKNYWDELYINGETGWDIGSAAPAISDYTDQLEKKDIKILIPGCGNAYEAGHLLETGFNNITLIDIAPALTSALEARFEKDWGKKINIITGDFFEHDDKYDLILEQTFLSALPPGKRPQYAEKMRSLLSPGGRLVGVLFNKVFEVSPPHGGSAEEYRLLFQKKFTIHKLEECYNSIERRRGTEVFINLEAI
jgi:SAM-dependent methyltransferase